jgi:asparagine synthase (glutamine-hydrolysing)
MCGIAGIISLDDRFPILYGITSMTNILRHRGPDDEGYLMADLKTGKAHVFGGKDTPDDVFASPLSYAPKLSIDSARVNEQVPQIGFGHRRLSIIDLSPAGHQPMCNANGTLWIVYNGEIYNYLELRSELQKLGHYFRSQSDTEVLLAAYEQWGRAALNRFIGMFAFAILDMPNKKLFLARDFFGIKPLYYTWLPCGFAFASEIKALLELPGISRLVNPQRLFEYLRFGITDHGGETLFSEIYQVPAAHWMEIPLDHKQPGKPVRYWDVDLTQRSNLSFEEAAEHLRELFLENISLHLRSDVPVGTALSGGIDSSSIVMAMRKLQKKNLTLHCFSYIADDPSINEEEWVDLACAFSEAIPHKIRLNAQDLQKEIEAFVHFQDEPFGSTSVYAQYRVFRLAQEIGVKVLLDGQGADEILGGYPLHLEAHLASLVRGAKYYEALALFSRVPEMFRFGRYNILTGMFRFLLPQSFLDMGRKLTGKELFPPWINGQWLSKKGVIDASRSVRLGSSVFHEELLRSMTLSVLPMLLRYEDRNSMASSRESRVPFLTPKIATFVMSLPESHFFFRNGITKAVFRTAMRGIVPDALLKRKVKLGFNTPQSNWLSAIKPWLDSILESEIAISIPAINARDLQRHCRLCSDGRVALTQQIWHCVNVILWTNQFSVKYG